MRCAICSGEKLMLFLSLGHQPPSDAFLHSEDLEKPETTYPLNLALCQDCFLVQLTYAVDPEILFRDYVYTTGTNNSLKKNFKQLVELLIERYALGPADLAIDIGSNDGTLLENYLPTGVRVLGIDPSSAATIAISRNIPTVVDFFNQPVAERVVAEYGKAKIITATNVFAHVVELDSFMQGLVSLLDEKGVFVSESHYLLDMIEGMQYDSIYHEHLRYYALKPLQHLFARYGLEIIDAERVTTHGGSIRVSAAHRGAYPVAARVNELIAVEEKAGLYQAETYHRFAETVVTTKFNLMKLVLGLKAEGKRIVGIGAPAKGNTLLNYCHFDSDSITYLVEKSDLKIGLFAPGTHIPVVAEQRLYDEQPEVGLILSWNIADELIPKLRGAGFKGSFIVPNPIPRIVT